MEIRPYSKNAKKHPKKQVEQIANSIKEFGMNQQIVVDKDGVIIVGHGRYEALKALGMEVKDEYIKVVDLTEEQAKAYRLADNKLNESDWDMELVIEELRGLSESMIDLTGFSSDLILDTDDKDDNVGGLPNVAKTEHGDLYILGRHRLLCGDSTKKEDLEKLMNGHKADMVFTDPPYNVDYKGKGKNTDEGIMNDKMSTQEFDTFLVETFRRMAENVKRTAGCYVFHSHKTMTQFEGALELAGFTIDTQLIWNKPSAGMGMNHYRTKHEPFFYCALEREKTFYGDRTGTTVWKIPDDIGRAIKWMQKEQENLESGNSTIWSMKRANVSEYVHPTQKPVELAVTAMTKSSKTDDIVLYQFLGSGTTLISAEKANRVCYGMELDPKFVDVIVDRYVTFTGNREIIKNGQKISWNLPLNKNLNETEQMEN